MKLSEQWLREWVNPSISRDELCAKLTMAGLEVEALTPVAGDFTNVFVAQVLHVEKHPDADRLKVCKVDVGQVEPMIIVCGATNVKQNMKVAAALPGAELPHNVKISRSKIRNVISNGMLCSARELGMTEESDGIIELPHDAPVGEEVRKYLDLSDYVIDVAVTPNRGDCLSVLGIAKEVSALTGVELATSKSSSSTEAAFATHQFSNLTEVELATPKSAKIESTTDSLTVKIENFTDCPRYAGRVIRQVQADAISPIWMQERLRRSGVRCISPIVDVMNYVMLELGQPMHAFDLQKIEGSIHVRLADASEHLTLLDGQVIQLSNDTMVIADPIKPLAIAGVMGGLDSGVTLLTKDIFLESAFFSPKSIARTVRKYNLGSESSYRFERGIDPELQVRALERATELLLPITGGQPGPIVDVVQKEHLPCSQTVQLRLARVHKILGIQIQPVEMESYLKKLGFDCIKNTEGWLVTVPGRRSDISLEVDLIEEIMRLYGYEKLPTEQASSGLQIHPLPEDKLNIVRLKHALCDFGYHEVITYSFVEKKIQQLLDPASVPKEIRNPITTDMAVMRTNLWPGLINTFLYNQNRQQSRVRIFEIGLRFIQQTNELMQQRMLAGLVSGSVLPEQWGVTSQSVDFFDLKGDLEKLFKLTFENEVVFKTGTHPALHPGQTAEIYRGHQSIGICGVLHPEIMQALGIDEKIVVFELALDQMENARLPRFTEISKFPEIRRDIAIFVDQTVPSQAIQDTIVEVGGDLLRDVTVFDVYQGKGVVPHSKSIALALTLQHSSRTLVDEEVAGIVERIVVALKERYAAELRG